MFILAERKQRRLARLLFLLGCLTPTLIVVGWSIYRQTSTEAARYSAALSASLGTHVAIERVWHPRPGVTILDRLSCRHPITGSIWARVAQVRIDSRAAPQDIELVQAELVVEETDSLAATVARSLPTEQIHRLASALHAQRMTVRWNRDDQPSDLPLALTVEQLRVSAEGPETVHVEGQLSNPSRAASGDHDSGAARFTLTCQRGLALSPASQPTQPPSITSPTGQSAAPQAPTPKSPTSLKPTCAVTLRTHAGQLPVYLFAPTLAQQLGPAARFAGMIRVAWRGGQSELTCTGRLTDWNLQRATLQWSHHGLWGQGELQLDDCRVTNGRLIETRGRLRIARAEASQVLADRLAEFWGSSIAPVADEPSELAWDFQIDTHRSLVRVDSHGGVRLRDQPSTSLTLGGTLERPLVDWVRLMLPPTNHGLPITAQTLPYLQHLAWPAHELPLDGDADATVAEPTRAAIDNPERSDEASPTPVVRLRGAATWK